MLKSTLGGLPGVKSGSPEYLTAEDEEELANFVTRSASIGFGRTRKDGIALAQRILEICGFKKTSVSTGW